MSLLEVTDLKVSFNTSDGVVQAVRGISFNVDPGRTLGIVGESGSGKSVTSLAIMGLHPPGTAKISGKIWLDGQELISSTKEAVRSLRGRKMAMIFQDPLAAMHPFYSVGAQIVEAYRIHHDVSKATARRHAIDLLDRVGIPQPKSRVDDYPHQFSGGMRQRAMIAMALACEPKLLIADEPTTALDVTVQAQVLDLLDELRQSHNMAMILITHDMGVIAEAADEVAVMYAGQIVESAPAVELFDRPEHPYTEALLSALPQLEGENVRDGRLTAIPGRPPDLLNPPEACRFAPRCPHAHLQDSCRLELPELREIRNGHFVRSAHPASERVAAGSSAPV
jgi:peptide/nickel transport system ATP-binding protein